MLMLHPVPILLRAHPRQGPLARIHAESGALDVFIVQDEFTGPTAPPALHPVVGAVIGDLEHLLEIMVGLNLAGLRVLPKKVLMLAINQPQAHDLRRGHGGISTNFSEGLALRETEANGVRKGWRKYGGPTHLRLAVL